MLAEVSVRGRLRRDGDADGGGDQPVRLVGLRLAHDDEDHLPGAQVLQTLGLRDDLAAGREDAAHPDEVEVRNPRVAQGHLERVQLLFMATDALVRNIFFETNIRVWPPCAFGGGVRAPARGAFIQKITGGVNR